MINLGQVKLAGKAAVAVVGALYINGVQETLTDKIRKEKKKALKAQDNKEFYVPEKKAKTGAQTWSEALKGCVKEIGADVSNNIIIGGYKYAEHGIGKIQRETMDKNIGIVYRKGGAVVEQVEERIKK